MLSFIYGLGETGPEQERSNETVILGNLVRYVQNLEN